LRKSVGLPDSKLIPSIVYQTANPDLVHLIREAETDLARLVKASRIIHHTNGKMAQATISADLFDSDFSVFLPLDEAIDLKKEVERLDADLKKKIQYRESLSKKLNNPDFAEKAPSKVLEKEREKLSETEKLIEETEERLRVFKSAK
jgi:valyl-tRNA synthetase